MRVVTISSLKDSGPTVIFIVDLAHGSKFRHSKLKKILLPKRVFHTCSWIQNKWMFSKQ